MYKYLRITPKLNKCTLWLLTYNCGMTGELLQPFYIHLRLYKILYNCV